MGPEIFNYQHPDLAQNVDPVWLTAQKTEGTLPSAFSNHATMVAGIMVAAKNGMGIVGVAPGAKIIGYALDNRGLDVTALGKMSSTDIVNHSWEMGPAFRWDNRMRGIFTAGLSIDAILSTVQYAASNGRGGLGSVIISAGGNQRAQGGSSQGSPINNSRFSIQVGAINAAGDLSTLQIAQAAFSNPGASILVSAPGSNVVSTSQMIMTDHGSVFGQTISEAEGTSFATPIISGVVALMLEANPYLGYRDVQHILTLSAQQINGKGTVWNDNHARYWNGGALHTSHDYGFGTVDARAAVRLAETWLTKNTAANEIVLSGKVSAPAILQGGKISSAIIMPAGLQIEHVDIDLDLTFSNLSDLVVKLISPTGTESILLNRHGISSDDMSKKEKTHFSNVSPDSLQYRFMTTHDWGETSQGNWLLEITDLKDGAPTTLKNWALHLYGSKEIIDDTYFYTDEYPNLVKINAKRAMLDDSIHGSTGGRNTIHAAAVSHDITVNLLTGEANISGERLTIYRPHEIHNVFSGDGHDVLVANHSGSVLDGGRGHNQLTGGHGKDIFVIHRRVNGRDILIDFEVPNKDTIHLVGFSNLQLESLDLVIQGLDVHVPLPHGQKVIFQNQAAKLTDLKQAFVIQDYLVIDKAYFENHAQNKAADEGKDVVMLSGGGRGAGLIGATWSLMGKVYDHGISKANKFVVAMKGEEDDRYAHLPKDVRDFMLSMDSGSPKRKTQVDYRNAIRGFKPGEDQIDLSVIGVTSAADLILERTELAAIGGVAVVQGTRVLSRSLGNEEGPAILLYLDAIDPSQITMSQFIFKEDTPRSIAPIILALSDEATTFTTIRQSRIYRDWERTGSYQHLAWTGKGQGFLAYDKNQDGAITDLNEMAFVEYLPGARTDLEGLRAFDSNGDGQLDNKDTAWPQLGVWYDKNANGHCEKGEFRSLEEWQIQSISLFSDYITKTVDDVTIFGTGHYTRQNGSKGVLFDAALHFKDASIAEWERYVVSLTDNLIHAQGIASYGDGGMVFEEKDPKNDLSYFTQVSSEYAGMST